MSRTVVSRPASKHSVPRQRSQTPRIDLTIDGHLPREPLRIGSYLDIVIHGTATSFNRTISSVELTIGKERVRQSFQGFPRPDRVVVSGPPAYSHHRLFCGFAVTWSGKLN